ncbi:MAG: UvrD-helicase domain-containing protein, partial [Alphaproteobacteria bacterium]|nr:UvrD-helicase domain-containing protein [Alphaproteobacteria bacterium]
MLQNLNNEQRLAVETTDGPLLVLSGAGTGKTRVLTTRIAYILNNHLAMPWQVLALTFTNKAANEMKTRLESFSDGAWYAGDVWCGTFHSICLRILRANAERAGLRRDFIIYGEDDQKNVIKSILTTSTTKTPAAYVEEFSAVKDKGLIALKNTDRLFNAYNAELLRLNAVDFGDIILRVLELFDKNPDILARYQNQFKYILVDEFQDTNNAQMEFLGLLTRDIENPNICCVGDDDQSIYSWRGAEIKHILNFDKTFPNAQIIRLETNYRSTSNILNAANSLIRHNRGRLGKDLRSADASGCGEPVYVLTLPTDRDESRIIADAILRESENDFSRFALLIRAGSLSRIFEEEFASRGIPYKLIGATKFYDRMEIRDVIAYLRLLVYSFDDMSFLRVIAKPRRGFGDKAIANLRASGGCLMDALRTTKLAPKLRAAADEFLSAFDFEWPSMSPRDAAQTLLERTGYMKMWSESKDADAPDRLSNIRELITSVISKYDTLSEFLEQAALMMTDDNDSNDNPQNNNSVRIMTIHAAKGLEFDTVFLPAWEDGIFPNDKAINEGAIEEERRLAYVAITRARRRCVISNAMMRVVFGSRAYNSPSRFIAEMDGKYLDIQGGVPRPSYTAYGNVPRSYDAPAKPRIQKTASLSGKLVSHNELGSGVVIEDAGAILTVAFKSRGIKKVAREYIKIIG